VSLVPRHFARFLFVRVASSAVQPLLDSAVVVVAVANLLFARSRVAPHRVSIQGE
jgi:hypothetical protein